MTKKIDVIEIETTPVDLQAKRLFDRVADYLTGKEWNFTGYEDQQYLTLDLRLRDGTVRVYVDTVEDAAWTRILVYSTYPTFVPVHRRPAVAEAISRINYATIFGNLEMDMNDGEVRTRAVLEGDSFISEEMIDRAIRKSVDLADQYQATLLAIAFGNVSPQDVLEMSARDVGATVQ